MEAKKFPERTLAEVKESVRYGMLYIVMRQHGARFICLRVRTRKGVLIANKDEQVTIERTDKTHLVPEIGDFAFVSNDRTWSLWKRREVPCLVSV
jgi:hypothetical protein